MTSSAHPPPGATRRLRAVALVALASLACTTVRVPAGGIEPSVKVRGDVAEPQVELWIESGQRVGPAEAAQATADARAALAQALSGRRLGEGDQLLVVRAQGVTRTSSRRADQTAAVAGIAIAAVAIVAVVVVALVATQGKGGGGGAKVPAVHSAPAVVARPAGAGPALVHAVPARVPVPTSIPAPPRPPAHVVPTVVAAPRPAPAVASHAHGSIALDVGVQVEGGPAPQVASADAEWAYAGELAPPPPPPPLAAEEEGEVLLAALPPLDVGQRGFFAKDLTRLELTLVDRATGAPLWVKTVERRIDPRDACAVRKLLDAALDDAAGWARAPVPVATR